MSAPGFVPGPNNNFQHRSFSPVKDERLPKALKLGGALDLRAEEEAARRINAGRVSSENAGYGGMSGRGKRTDLFGMASLKVKVGALAKDHGMTIDDEALSYIALAAESRIRSLLSSSISAQTHRTSSSHFREPPLQTSPSSSSSGKPAKPMWSHRVTSDANAVLDALSRANKDAEQSFRASRMDRLAHETELARARERVEKAVEAETGSGSSFGPSTNEISPVTAHGNGTPVFGTVAEKKGTKKAGKKAARDVSAEVQHKMSNAMAMRSAGVSKKYSWLTSVPNVSSPLAGRKRKAGQEGAAEAPGAMTAEAGEAGTKAGDGREKSRGKGKERNGEGGQQFKGLSEVHEDETPTKRLRSGLVLSAPTRRLVLVDRNSLGQERRIQDNRVVTMMDLLFAMERDGLGKGMGTADEIFRRVWAIGGYWKDTGNKGRG